MNYKYFLGLSLPKDFGDQINSLQHRLYDPALLLRQLQPHITLLHPGALQTLAPEYFLPLAQAAAAPFLPLAFAISGFDRFDKRVVYLSVDSPALAGLQEALVSLLPDKVRAQYYVGRGFTPHVTLAQAQPYKQLPDDLIETWRQAVDPLLPRSCQADSLTYFKWRGPRQYESITLSGGE